MTSDDMNDTPSPGLIRRTSDPYCPGSAVLVKQGSRDRLPGNIGLAASGAGRDNEVPSPVRQEKLQGAFPFPPAPPRLANAVPPSLTPAPPAAAPEDLRHSLGSPKNRAKLVEQPLAAPPRTFAAAPGAPLAGPAGPALQHRHPVSVPGLPMRPSPPAASMLPPSSSPSSTPMPPGMPNNLAALASLGSLVHPLTSTACINAPPPMSSVAALHPPSSSPSLSPMHPGVPPALTPMQPAPSSCRQLSPGTPAEQRARELQAPPSSTPASCRQLSPPASCRPLSPPRSSRAGPTLPIARPQPESAWPPGNSPRHGLSDGRMAWSAISMLSPPGSPRSLSPAPASPSGSPRLRQGALPQGALAQGPLPLPSWQGVAAAPPPPPAALSPRSPSGMTPPVLGVEGCPAAVPLWQTSPQRRLQ